MTGVLTKRERQVLILKANGNTSQRIATWLGITRDTVGSHLASIYRKYGVSSDCHAVAVGTVLGDITIRDIIIPTTITDEEPV